MSSTRPLSGLTVIEIGHSVAAPYAGMILGELGAEVIKVENPKGGDACRGWGPPFTEGHRDRVSRLQPRQARHHDRSRRPGSGRQAAGADPRPRRCADPQPQIRHARPLRPFGRRADRREAEPRLVQSRRVRGDRAVARPAGLRPDDAGLWRADEPAWARTGGRRSGSASRSSTSRPGCGR